jgi:hypothetical protein
VSKLQLVASEAVTTLSTSAPTAATDGVALKKGRNRGKPNEGFDDGELENLVLYYRATVTAGQTASMSFLRLWVYVESVGTADWYPLGPALQGGTDTDRGKLNAVVALGEIGTDKINLTQVINIPGGATRIYLQLGTSGGSGYADTAWLVKGWGA